MQWTYQKFPNKLLKIYRWKSQIEWKTLKFPHQNIFLIKMTLWRGRMQFLQPLREIFNIRSKKIAQCTKMIKNYSIFQKKKLKCFYGHNESSFHNFVEKFSTKGQKIIARGPKRKNKPIHFFEKIFLKKCSYGHEESSFHNLAEILSTKRQNNRLKVWKKYHNICFSKKISFVNMFFWTHWMQLSQCRQKVFNEVAKLTRSISKTAKTSLLFSQTKRFSQKLWHRNSECSLTTPPKVSQQMVKMLLLKVRKR